MSRSLDPYLLVHTLAISLLLSPNPSNLFLSFRKDAAEGEAGDDDVHVSTAGHGYNLLLPSHFTETRRIFALLLSGDCL